MSSSFGRLLYTDCRVGEGLGSGGGLQIQAKSSEVDSEQARMAVGALVYSIPSSWFGNDRPVEDYPEGFAHSAEAGYGTAQSRYLGAGVNDLRPGNHLADCLLTRQATDYGLIRPAQLWKSPIWNSSARPSTDYPPFTGELEVGPLDNDSIVAWLRAAPRRAEILKQLVSVLENAKGPQVHIRSDSAQSALFWLAAATILLPVQDALAVSFRVFNSSRNEARFRVLGLHSELVPTLVPGSRPGTFLLDDVELTSDAGDVSPRASFWVERLLRADDPDDVVEAVELATVLSDGLADAARLDDARITAWSLVARDDASIDPASLSRWLASASTPALEQYGGEAAQRLLDAPAPSARDLAIVNRLIESGELKIDAQVVRLRLVQAEVRDAQDGIAPSQAVQPVPITAAQNEEARQAVASAMVSADDAAVARLLTVVGRHRIKMQPATPAYRERLAQFVSGWIAAPQKYEPSAWGNLDDSLILDELTDQLSRFAESDREKYSAAVAAFATLLSFEHADAADELAWDIEANVERSLPVEERRRRIHDVIDGKHVAVDSLDQAVRLRNYQKSLLSWRVLDRDEDSVLEVVTAIPAQISLAEPIQKAAIDILKTRATTPDEITIKAVAKLRARQALPDSGRLADLAKEVSFVGDIEKRVPAVRTQKEHEDLDAALQRLERVSPGVLRVSLPSLRSAALLSLSPVAGTYLLRRLPAQYADAFAGGIVKQLQQEPSARTLRYAAAWIHDDPGTSESARRILTSGWIEVLRGIAPEFRAALLDDAAPKDSDYWASTWELLLEQVEPATKRSWWPRGRRR